MYVTLSFKMVKTEEKTASNYDNINEAPQKDGKLI
jgi:hypothetical protein